MCELSGMTQLAAYLAKTNTPQSRLAEAIGVSRGYMNQLVKGIRTPSLPVALAIERATKGKVKVAHLLEARQ